MTGEGWGPVRTDARAGVLARVADRVEALANRDVRRVAVDGVDGAGKTTFADELAAVLGSRGTVVVRASVDGFHRPRAARYRRGRASPTGFYEDSYDYRRLVEELLAPLGPGGSRRFRRAVHDVRDERALDLPWEEAAPRTVLVLDGIFLHRDELAGHWDLSVFLDVGFATSVPRGARRDGGSPDPRAAVNRRYVEGQRLYLAAARPRERADLVVDNTDLAAPRIVPGPAPGSDGGARG